ncbi:MAG: NAD(P)/FAD-dependent oxidoreductase [Solirubrobacterales bacterium]|nr:NAD(P)/FAD-dependent oxidoreductase [Solirubrobacterales bacterium]
MNEHHRIVIVGGGTAGISVAARLCRVLDEPDLAVIEPSATHYYQPLWTLVGGGVAKREASARPEAGLIPAKASWIQSEVTEVRPEENGVVTADGREITYEYLVMAPGLVLRWDGIEGIEGRVGKDGICSNYEYDQCHITWETISSFEGGTALFTMPPPPIKCAGAPQKIMYMADDTFRKNGVRDRSQVIYGAATPGVFSVRKYAETLDDVISRRGIDARYQQRLSAVRPDEREAVFTDADGKESVIGYDMLHVAPPQGPPRFVAESPLAGEGGWCEADRSTLQHPRFGNVFSLGDASSLPTSKTGAAIRAQAPVLTTNLLAVMNGGQPTASYDGYTACPLVTGYGKLLMAEFDYDLNPTPTLPLIDSGKERWGWYQFKRYGLPWFYWNMMLRGRG